MLRVWQCGSCRAGIARNVLAKLSALNAEYRDAGMHQASDSYDAAYALYASMHMAFLAYRRGRPILEHNVDDCARMLRSPE